MGIRAIGEKAFVLQIGLRIWTKRSCMAGMYTLLNPAAHGRITNQRSELQECHLDPSGMLDWNFFPSAQRLNPNTLVMIDERPSDPKNHPHTSISLLKDSQGGKVPITSKSTSDKRGVANLLRWWRVEETVEAPCGAYIINY